ncbi:hypothetical protein BN1232_04222 [Mycobacterium lentiflavum]|uniref:Uncharacterized protein n=1 Tax=Mycobacterium lentiflavum TaxID=141349 RepID=A0A0E3WD78_MYCLN|nr:hypothetical protein BN1232_04222 [Mycobacterium lentiflavum]
MCAAGIHLADVKQPSRYLKTPEIPRDSGVLRARMRQDADLIEIWSTWVYPGGLPQAPVM